MDQLNGFHDPLGEGHEHHEPDQGGLGEQMFDLGGDERRMHVRAYNHWVSLLDGRPYPSIEDIDPASLADFGPNSVLLDFGGTVDNPQIDFLGASLRAECGLDHAPRRMDEVPGRSLLSRLTDHYLQIIANRAPIGFEAEFVSTRGHPTLYRGILMPFSSAGSDAIDFIYGVISWKELVDARTQALLAAELDAAVRDAPRLPAIDAPVWADGPGAESAEAADTRPTGSLAERLSVAREYAAAVRAADTRSRAALYRALGRAHDFAVAAAADPAGFRRLLAETGIREQVRAPLTPVAKLVFGIDYDKTRLTEFAAVLTHARHLGVEEGGLGDLLAQAEGGIKAVVAAERARRRPAGERAPAVAPLAGREALATLSLPERASSGPAAAPGEPVLLVARARADGGLDVLGTVSEPALTARVVARLR